MRCSASSFQQFSSAANIPTMTYIGWLKNPYHRVDFPSEPVNKRAHHAPSAHDSCRITAGTRFAYSFDK
jgi:hypothetical protein